MGAVINLIEMVIDHAPHWIAQGLDMVAMIKQARAAFKAVGTSESVSVKQLQALDVKIAALEKSYNISLEERLAKEG